MSNILRVNDAHRWQGMTVGGCDVKEPWEEVARPETNGEPFPGMKAQNHWTPILPTIPHGASSFPSPVGY